MPDGVGASAAVHEPLGSCHLFLSFLPGFAVNGEIRCWTRFWGGELSA